MSSDATRVPTSASRTIPAGIGIVPRCQSLARATWIERRQADLLDQTQYFHVVFTVPDTVAAVAFQNKAVVYALLFRTAAETLRTIAADPQHLGAEIGCVAVLHTLPVRVLSRLFRRLLLEALHAAFAADQLHFFGTLQALADRQAFVQYLAPARQAEWVVYATPPFAGPQQVLDYVGRYPHRVAIANTRLLDLEAGQVRFRYQDYRDHGQKTMTLSADEFLRRVLLHVLPARFPRIRHYGLLGNRHRREKLARCRHLLGIAAPETPTSASTAPRDYRDRFEALTGRSLRTCPVCRHGHMSIVEDLARARRDAAITDTS